MNQTKTSRQDTEKRGSILSVAGLRKLLKGADPDSEVIIVIGQKRYEIQAATHRNEVDSKRNAIQSIELAVAEKGGDHPLP